MRQGVAAKRSRVEKVVQHLPAGVLIVHLKHRKGEIADMYECGVASLATRKSTISIQF